MKILNGILNEQLIWGPVEQQRFGRLKRRGSKQGEQGKSHVLKMREQKLYKVIFFSILVNVRDLFSRVNIKFLLGTKSLDFSPS